MISLRLFITTLALAVKLDNVRAADTWTSLQAFSYIPYDNIHVNIILKNVPVEAISYVLYSQTDNCDRREAAQNSAVCDVPVRRDTIPTSRTITYMQKLDRESLRIYIVLRKENKICATKWIMDGVRDNSANVNPFHEACLNKYQNLCNIIADFGNQCEDSRANIFCSQKERLICEVNAELPEETVHQWYQAYRDGSLIGTIPAAKGDKTEFKMTIHKFDSNTYISSVMNSAQNKKYLLTENFKIPIPTDGYKNYDVKVVERYTANQPVKLNCSNNAHTQVAWIDSTGNRITTYNKTTVSWRLTKLYNGSMLCCLNYRIDPVGKKTIVERTVTNITVLVYEESLNPDNKASTTDPPNKNSMSPQKPTNTGTASRPQTHNTSAARSDTQRQEGPTSPNGSADPWSDATNYYIAIAAVAGIILLSSLIYVINKKCCRKSSDPEQTLQLETYATANTVLYAELDIRPGTGPAPASTEDATYAEIAGVIRPENGHVKK